MTGYSIPALIALSFKFFLLLYAAKSPVKNENTRLFLFLLVALSLHNLSEVILLNYFPRHGVDAVTDVLGYSYFATLIPSIAILLHLSLRFASGRRIPPAVLALFYLPTCTVEYLLLFTDTVVAGFTPFQFSVIRIAGPLYFLFETYMILYLSSALAILLYGVHKNHKTTIARIRSRLWLVGVAPMSLLTIYLLLSRHLDWPQLTSTFYVPITQSFFLLVATYAIHQYRLFDIEFFFPWSRTRAHKVSFYRQLQAMVAEIPALPAIDSAVVLTSQILNCPAVLIGEGLPADRIVKAGDRANQLASFPHERLKEIDRMVVAAEIEWTMPEVYRVMRRFDVAAVVPLYPPAMTNRRLWLLLGQPFSEQVYSPTDFMHVERLFRALAQRIHEVEKRMELIKGELEKAETRNAELRDLLRKAHEDDIRSGPALRLEPGLTFDDQVDAFGASLLRRVLQTARSKSEAARLLGLRPNTLHYKMKRYGIQPETVTDHKEKHK